MGPVRHPLRRPSRPAPHPHVPGVRGASAAQGLPAEPAPAAGARSAIRSRSRGTRGRRAASHGAHARHRSCPIGSRRPIAARARSWRSRWGRRIRRRTAPSSSTCGSTARPSSTSTSRSATCTAASRRCASRGRGTTCFPYADRLNYASPLLNNVGFALAVEKLAGIDGARALPVHPRHRRRDLAHHRSPHLPRHGGAARSARSRPASTCSRRASSSTTSSRRSPARGSRSRTAGSAA